MRVSVKAILSHEGKFLLLRPANVEGSVNGWDIPGGTVQEGESLEKTLQREVMEETGVDLRNFTFLKSMIMIKNDTRYEIFWGKLNTHNIKLSKEHIEYRWVDEKELAKLTGFDLTQVHKRSAPPHPIVCKP